MDNWKSARKIRINAPDDPLAFGRTSCSVAFGLCEGAGRQRLEGEIWSRLTSRLYLARKGRYGEAYAEQTASFLLLPLSPSSRYSFIIPDYLPICIMSNNYLSVSCPITREKLRGVVFGVQSWCLLLQMTATGDILRAAFSLGRARI